MRIIMTATLYLFLVIVLAGWIVPLSLCFSPECSTIVTITGNHSLQCTNTHQSGTTNQWQCADLQSALMIAVELEDKQQDTSNCISIAVPPGDHLVTEPVYFGAANVSIFGTGQRSDDVTIFCNYTVDVNESWIFDLDYNYTDYTFYFNRSEVVSFEMVQFIGCPYPLRLDTVAAVTMSNSTFRNFSEAIFDIFNCADVSIIDSTFVNNSGTGISRHSFRANTGAVSIGYNNAPTYFPQIVAKVIQCAFINNRATAANNVRSTNAAFFTRKFTGRGGGLGVFCNETYHNISLQITDNYFENNYAKSFGGALYFVKFGEWTQTTYNLSGNSFTNNVAPLGGGAISNTFFSSGIPGSPNRLLMTDCIFIGSIGQSGGALSLYLPYAANGTSFIQCERCYFGKNHGNNTRDEYGAAIAIYRVNQFENRDSVPKYKFIDCTFENNTGNNGIFTVTHFPLTFNGTTKFIGNTGTDALKIIGSLVEFVGNVLFMNHSGSGSSSVALHLLSFGQIRFHYGLQLTFVQNKGTYGASILVDTPTASTTFDHLLYNPQCFALYVDPLQSPGQWENVSVSFQRNKAVLGSSILIARLGTCSWVSADNNPNFNITYVYDWPIWDYGDDSINTAYEDSNTTEYSFVTTVESIITNNQSVKAWPGKRFIIQLAGLDQFKHETTFTARFTLTNHFSLPGDVVVNFSPSLVVNYATVNLSLVRNFNLTYSISSGEALGTDGPLGVTIDDPIDYVEVKPATFLLYPDVCPAGYRLVSIPGQVNFRVNQMECQCDQNNSLIIHCENDQDGIIVREGYWGAAVKDIPNHRYDMFLYPCPPGYCKCSQNTSLGPSSCAFTYTNSDPDAQCACGRQGILCGECRDGKGVSVLLNNCVSCHNAKGLLVLGLIIADVIAFIAIIVADAPFPEWIYPFIFYIQVAPSVAIFFPESFITGGKFFYFISSALSFYFVYDFCLYGDMSPLVSYFFRFLPFLVILLLSPAIVIFREKKMMMLKHHGIWWIILLLYTHVIHTSMMILDCPVIPSSTSTPRWFVNGNIGCFTGWHIPLALLAIVVLIMTTLLIPLACLISLKRRILKVQKVYWLKYFEDPLTMSYKEKWRWWSAVELARRFIFILFVVPFPRNSMMPMFVMSIMLVIYGLVQPYKSKLTNALEMVVQINFILLLALESTSFLKDTYNTFPAPSRMQAANNNMNETVAVCRDNFSGISDLSKILLPFYYLPLLLFVVTAVAKLITYYARKSRSARKEYLLTLSDSVKVINRVTMTELKLTGSSNYSLVIDDT